MADLELGLIGREPDFVGSASGGNRGGDEVVGIGNELIKKKKMETARKLIEAIDEFLSSDQNDLKGKWDEMRGEEEN